MQKHVKIFLKHYGYSALDEDFIPCLGCGKKSVDIHHLLFRSHGGTNEIDNLAPLCRRCHDQAHADPEFNKYLKDELRRNRTGNSQNGQ
jgi:5-methylcytosine-specific restriction endonuclease McrA